MKLDSIDIDFIAKGMWLIEKANSWSTTCIWKEKKCAFTIDGWPKGNGSTAQITENDQNSTTSTDQNVERKSPYI